MSKFGERPGDMEAIALVNSFKAKGEGELYVTDIQLIAKALREAEQRGAERERAAVVAWLRRGLSFDARAEAIEAGKHREEE